MVWESMQITEKKIHGGQNSVQEIEDKLQQTATPKRQETIQECNFKTLKKMSRKSRNSADMNRELFGNC